MSKQRKQDLVVS